MKEPGIVMRPEPLRLLRSRLQDALRGRFVSLASLVPVALLMAGPAAAQVLALPHSATNVPFTSTADEAVFTVDLDTLAPRPRLVSEVTPDASHPDLQIETEWVCNVACFFGSGFEPDFFCNAAAPCVSDERLSSPVHVCSPFGPRVGETCDVRVRVLDFGAAGAPANVDVSIFSETDPVTNTQEFTIDPTPVQTSVSIPRNRDTTIYEETSTGSNGQGQFIWAGTEVSINFPSIQTNDRRGLLTFDFGNFISSPVPPGATIEDAELILDATTVLASATTVSVTPVADAGGFTPSQWFSGDADAAGNEFQPGFGVLDGATWTTRGGQSNWNTPGGDLDGPAVASETVISLGPVVFQSPALTDVVETMWLTKNDDNGLILRDATPGGSPIFSRGVQFGSGENSNASLHPELVVYYTPEIHDPIPGFIETEAHPFIGEGDDFRWIYDTSVIDAVADGVVSTDIGGECTVNDQGNPLALPYDYQFLGDPAFEGLDCCTWEMRSEGEVGNPDDDVLGTGQALFFINLDPLDPANIPGDLDGDGILDLCDNCMWRPNGPSGGTCVGGPSEGLDCQSNQVCGTGGLCNLSQEDADGDFIGDACLVPEPGFVTMLGSGVFGLAGISGRRRRHR